MHDKALLLLLRIAGDELKHRCGALSHGYEFYGRTNSEDIDRITKFYAESSIEIEIIYKEVLYYYDEHDYDFGYYDELENIGKMVKEKLSELTQENGNHESASN